MRNLSRITNYANKIESLKEWREAVDLAIAMEQYTILAKYRPNLTEWSWRKIDRFTVGLLEDLSRVVEVDLLHIETISERINVVRWAHDLQSYTQPNRQKDKT